MMVGVQKYQGKIVVVVVVVVCILFSLLAGCTLDQSPTIPTSTPTAIVSEPVSPLPPTTQTVLVTDMGPFDDHTALLAGVCFEYLYAYDGDQWVWTTPDDLTAFYHQVNESELCPGPVQSESFDFTDQVLVGAIWAARGCDAAYHLIDVQQDDRLQTFTLRIALDVRSGCPYELIQPLLIAVPRLPATHTITIEWVPAADPSSLE